MRRIEKFVKDTGWVAIEFQNLKDGDIFRIFDDGERYVNQKDGNNVWVAVGEPFLKDEIWTVDTLY